MLPRRRHPREENRRLSPHPSVSREWTRRNWQGRTSRPLNSNLGQDTKRNLRPRTEESENKTCGKESGYVLTYVRKCHSLLLHFVWCVGSVFNPMPLDFHPLKSDFVWELVYTTIGLLYLSKNVYLFHYHFGKSFTLPFETMPTTLPITYCFLFRTFPKICSGWGPSQAT